MKRVFAITMLLGLLGFSASAFALPYTFEVAGRNDASLRATVSASYDPGSAIASFTIVNTTATQGTITGFAFNLPNNGSGVSTVTNLSTALGWHLLSSPIYTPNTIDTPMQLGHFDVGLGTGVNFGGGFPLLGIGQGQSLTFTLLFTGTGLNGLTTGSILAALSSGESLNEAFALRFQNTTGGGSDVATPTPLPPAVWLLGSGLLGIMGFRNRRTS